MLPFLPLLLGGAGLGALLNKKDPLKGAMMGAALGAGGAALPGLLGAGGATAGIGSTAAAGAAEGAAASTLLAEPFAGAALGSGSAQLGTGGLLGTGSAASGTAAAETAGAMMGQGAMSTAGSTIGETGGLLAGLEKYGKPAMVAMDAASKGQQMAAANEPPPIQAPQRQSMPLDLSSILNQSTQWQQYDAAENERRKQLMAQYAQGIGRV